MLGSFYRFMGCFEYNLCLRAIFCLFLLKSHAAPLKAFNILCLFLKFKCPYLVYHTSLSLFLICNPQNKKTKTKTTKKNSHTAMLCKHNCIFLKKMNKDEHNIIIPYYFLLIVITVVKSAYTRNRHKSLC